MKLITTFENTFIEFIDILNDNEASSLENLKENIKRNYKPSLVLGSDGFKIKDFVGIIKLNNTIIEVLPKFYKDNSYIEVAEKQEIYKNIYYMINKSMKIPKHNLDFQNFEVSRGNILDFFIYIFLQKLYKSLTKGTYKTYIREEVNSKYIKGKVLINKTITKNILGLSIYSETDHYTEDNLVNQIFKYVVKNMHNISSWDKNKKLAKQILYILTDIQDIYVHDSTFSKIKKDRLLSDFEQLLSFSRFYINNQTMVNYKHTDNSSFIFNINMSSVFQEYVSELLKEYSSEIINSHQIHVQKSDQHLIYNNNNKGKFRLKPDINIHYNDEPRVIIDTKYKLLDSKKPRKGVMDVDLYQMFGYYHKYQEPRIILLYPQYREPINDTYFFYENQRGQLNVSTVNLSGSIYKKNKELEIVKRLKYIIFPD